MNQCDRTYSAAAVKIFAMLLIAASPLSFPSHWPGAVNAQEANGEFIYRAQRGDTLIGISNRLLIQPKRWMELQKRNRIAEPRRIPPGSSINIPYAWLRVIPEDAEVIAVQGDVTHSGQALAVGDHVSQDDLIRTGANGSVALKLADGSVVNLQKNSSAMFTRLQRIDGVPNVHEAKIKLTAGRLQTTAKPQRDMGRFEIATPVAVSAVRGTQFRTSFDGETDRSTTETLEGRVDVAAKQIVVVPAGFGTRVDSQGVPATPTALLPPPALSATPAINTQPMLTVSIQQSAASVAHRVQLSGDESFNVLLFDEVISELSTQVPINQDGVYWLRVRSIDQSGLEGTDAVMRVEQRTLPAAPTLQLPLNAIASSSDSIHLQWSGDGAARYRLQLARDPEFKLPIQDNDSLTEGQIALQSLPTGKYYWRVSVIADGYGASEWSEVRSFTVLPTAPMSDAPIDKRRQLLFAWPGKSGEHYRVQISKQVDFRQIDVDQRTTEPMLITERWPGTRYIRIQVIDEHGVESDFGPVRKFSVTPKWLKWVLPVAVILPFA
jgi:hypothetical protein